MTMDDDALEQLYAWIDQIPLSRHKKNITRDFSDGVLFAEVVHHYYPHLVEMHNYSAANSFQQKMVNLNTLNQKAFRKLSYNMTKKDMEEIARSVPRAVERVLFALRGKLAKYGEKQKNKSQPPSAREHATPSVAAPARGGGMPASRNNVAMSARTAGTASPYAPPHSQQHTPGAPPQGGGMVGGMGAGAGGMGNRPYMPQQQQHMPLQSQHAGHVGSAPPMGPGMAGRYPQQHPAQGGVSSNEVNELLMEKDQVITELKETVEILELKVAKLEQLLHLKDTKISKLQQQAQHQHTHMGI
eukprot:Rmarinus@m.7561